jgi:hypothetical protein
VAGCWLCLGFVLFRRFLGVPAVLLRGAGFALVAPPWRAFAGRLSAVPGLGLVPFGCGWLLASPWFCSVSPFPRRAGCALWPSWLLRGAGFALVAPWRAFAGRLSAVPGSQRIKSY